MKKISIPLLILLFFASCETDLDISSVTQKSKLVVNTLINDQEVVKVWVSKSTVISDSVKPPPLQGAVVTVTDEAGNVSNCTYNGFTEYYESTLTPVAGKKYTIKVKANGFTDAWADVQLPTLASLQQSTWKDSTGVDSFDFPTGTILVNINDKIAEKNYYRITIYYWESSGNEWRVLGPASTDAEITNRAIKTEDGGIIFDDQAFNGKNRTIPFITPFGYSFQTPKFLVVSESLSDSYYRYFKSLDDYKNSGGIFTEPTAIFTNINNGLGIAAGSSVRKDVIN